VEISLPFNKKLMPAGLLAFTTTSWAARTEVWAGAIRVSVATDWPSAVMEIQEFCVARMSSVNLSADFLAATLAFVRGTAVLMGPRCRFESVRSEAAIAGEELARAEGCDGSEGMALEEIETGLGDTEDAAG
jgi:hypothetical protein